MKVHVHGTCIWIKISVWVCSKPDETSWYWINCTHNWWIKSPKFRHISLMSVLSFKKLIALFFLYFYTCIVGSRLTSPRPSIVGRSRKRALSHSPISDFLDIQSLTRSSEGSLQFPPFNLSTHNSRSSSAASGSYGHLSAGECVRLYNTQEILSLIEGIFLIFFFL